jgi:putative FmdB family regulatory protein
MPTYGYRCEACRHEFEEFQLITAKPLKKCPSCGKSRLIRLLGTGGAILFKGSGFYITDYRSESYKKAATSDSKEGASKAGDGASKGGESKSDSTKSADDAAAKPAAKKKPKGA